MTSKGRIPTPHSKSTVSAFVDQILQEALRLERDGYPPRTLRELDPFALPRWTACLNHPVPADMRHLHSAVVSRLKIMAGLNIAEKRLPHDGRIAMKTGAEEYDLRVSIVPTKYGEGVCLRILGRQSLFLDLGQLGMEPHQERVFGQLTQFPQGLVLLDRPDWQRENHHALHRPRPGECEGPQGDHLRGPHRVPARRAPSKSRSGKQIGLTFASGFRSVLRHDPDVVLVGEIRDFETAEIAVRAAQTGHLVFSTLHTNDSISAVTRLLEMRIEPYLIASSLVCSISQRLARRICRHCARRIRDYPPAIREEMAASLGVLPAEQVKACKGRGCVECNQRGHRGRVAIYEIFLVSEAIADLIEPGLKTGELRA